MNLRSGNGIMTNLNYSFPVIWKCFVNERYYNFVLSPSENAIENGRGIVVRQIRIRINIDVNVVQILKIIGLIVSSAIASTTFSKCFFLRGVTIPKTKHNKQHETTNSFGYLH
jgi:hypothetical protein